MYFFANILVDFDFPKIPVGILNITSLKVKYSEYKFSRMQK